MITVWPKHTTLHPEYGQLMQDKPLLIKEKDFTFVLFSKTAPKPPKKTKAKKVKIKKLNNIREVKNND